MKWLDHYYIESNIFLFYPSKNLIINANNRSESVLTNQCAQLLKLLCLSAGSIFDRYELIRYIWKENNETGYKGLNQAIWQLRKCFVKIGFDEAEFIKVHRNMGYQLDVDIRVKSIANDLCTDQPLIHDEGAILVGDFSVPLTSLQSKLLKHLANKSTSNDIYGLCSLLSCNRFELLNLVGRLQERIYKIHADALLLNGWDQYALYISTLSNPAKTDVHCSDLSVVGLNQSKEAQPEEPKTSHQAEQSYIGKISEIVCSRRILASTSAILFTLCLIFGYLFTQAQSHNKTYKNSALALVEELTKQLTQLSKDQGEKRKHSENYFLTILLGNFATIFERSHVLPLERVKVLLMLSSINKNFARYKQSELQLQEARGILTDNLGLQPGYSELFAEMQHLTAEFLILCGRYSEAKHFIDNALEKLPSENNVEILRKQKLNLQRSILFLKISQYENALITAQEIVAAIHHLPQSLEKSDLTFEATKYIAIALRYLGDLNGALTELEKLLSMNISTYGELNQKTVSVFQSLATVYTSMGEYEYALKHYRAVEKFYNSIDGKKLEKALVLHNLSYVLFELERDKEALNAIDKAIEIYDFHFGTKHSKHAFLHTTKANHLFHSGNILEAKKINAVAIKLFEHPDNIDHIFRAKTLEIAAHIYRIEGESTLCVNVMKAVSKLLADKLPDENHWKRKVAEITALSCSLPLDTLQNTEKMTTSSPIAKIINELENRDGPDSLPVRQIKHALAQRLF